MKRKYIKQFFIVALLWISGNSIIAQTDSLAYYLEVAAKNNPGLKADYLDYQASLQRSAQVGTLPDLQLDMGFFLQSMDIIDGSQVADFTLMQMFPWFGTRKAAQAEVNYLANKEFEKFRESRDNLFQNIYTQWFVLCDLKQKAINTAEHKTFLEQLEKLAIHRYSTSGDMSESLRIQLEMMELDNLLESIESQLISEKARFNTLLNRPATSEVQIPNSFEKIPFVLDISQAMEKVLAQNPVLASIHQEKLAFQAKAEADKKQGMPMVGVGLQYSMIKKRMGNVIPTTPMNGMDMLMPMVSVSIPIYRNKFKAQQKESKLQEQASEARYYETYNQLQAELLEINQNMRDALRKISLSEKQAELAQTTYNLLLNQFSTGKSSLSNIIEVQRQLLDYALAKTEAIAEYNTLTASVQRILSSFNSNIEQN